MSYRGPRDDESGNVVWHKVLGISYYILCCIIMSSHTLYSIKQSLCGMMEKYDTNISDRINYNIT